jgi:hypothetical protein
MGSYLLTKLAYFAFVLITLPIWLGIKLWPLLLAALPYVVISVILLAVVGVLLEISRYVRQICARFKPIFHSQQSSSSTHANERTTAPKDPYSILGVAEDVSPSELKARYHFLLFANHPDKLAHLDPVLQDAAKSRCQQIIEAYNQLRS